MFTTIGAVNVFEWNSIIYDITPDTEPRAASATPTLAFRGAVQAPDIRTSW